MAGNYEPELYLPKCSHHSTGHKTFKSKILYYPNRDQHHDMFINPHYTIGLGV
jgi:hypothetical protein